jgi:hypothetical protein
VLPIRIFWAPEDKGNIVVFWGGDVGIPAIFS